MDITARWYTTKLGVVSNGVAGTPSKKLYQLKLTHVFR